MYLEFYGLAEKPFSQTPDPRFLYWNDGNRETLASLTYGIRERKGFLTMIGEAGTGKTTLLRKLLEDLGSEVLSVFLFNPNATFEEILEYTLSELGISVPSGRKLAMLQRLNEFLLAAFGEGRNTILIIDEAQDLDSAVLESLRLLSNLETSQEKILQIVLSGQPELAARLAEPGLRQLKQRIAVRCRLEPLRREELGQYIAARLAVVGGRPDLFHPDTLDPIWSFAEGIPRLINMVCDNALLVGYALGRRPIDKAVIDEVIADLRGLDVDFGARGPVAAPLPAAPAVTPQPTIAAPTQAPAAAPPPSVVAPAPTPPSPPATFPPVTNATLTSFDPAAAPARLSTREVSRAPEQGAPRSGLRRLGVAVAAIALIGLGGAVTLWAQRGDRASWLLSRLGSDRAIGEEDRAVVVPVPARESEPKLAEPDAAPAAPDLSAAIDAPPSGPRAEVVPPSVESPLAGEPAAPSAQAAPAQQATARGDQAGDVAEPEPKPEDRTAAEAAALHVETPAEAEADAIDETPPTAPVVAPAASDDVPERTAAVAVEARAEAKAETQEVRSEPEPPEDARQAAIPSRPESSGGSARRMQVRSGDTLSNLANRAYGHANLTTLDMLRERNPRISDIDLILAGEEIEFPDPGPSARVLRRETGLSVLALTTPELVQALAIQEALEARYERPVDLEPTELGRRRDLYRVSIRALGGRGEALEIASRLGSILEDPGS